MNTSQFFSDYYHNVEVNSIMILDSDGNIVDVNRSFTQNFGYRNEEIKGKHFRILFSEKDSEAGKPQQELKTVFSRGQCYDENYIVDKRGHAIWCTGESVLVSGEDGKKFIVKDIINLQSRKQLRLFLQQTDELLERIFDSSKEVPMIVLDASLKVQKVNDAFLRLFDLSDAPPKNCRLADISHPFWKNGNLKAELSKILVSNEPLRAKAFSLETASGEKKVVHLDSKVIDQPLGSGRKIFIILTEQPVNQG
jgi:PAS domain S-box-containing protein